MLRKAAVPKRICDRRRAQNAKRANQLFKVKSMHMMDKLFKKKRKNDKISINY